MANYALLIDYEWCSGCHSCEVACKEEHGFPVGKYGIRVMSDGPWQINDKQSNWNKIPVPTDLCDLCGKRVSVGKAPACVHHCLCQAMKFGTIEELVPELEKKDKQVLFVPRVDKTLDWSGEIDTTSVAERVKGADVDFEYSEADAAGEAEINKSFKLALHREEQKLDETSDMEALEAKKGAE